MQYFKHSLHKQRGTVLITCQRIWMQLSTVITGPLSAKKKTKNPNPTKNPNQIKKSITTECFNLQPAGISSNRRQPPDARESPMNTLLCNVNKSTTWCSPKYSQDKTYHRLEIHHSQAVLSVESCSPQVLAPVCYPWALGHVPPLPPTPEASSSLDQNLQQVSVRSTRVVNYWHCNYSLLGI